MNTRFSPIRLRFFSLPAEGGSAAPDGGAAPDGAPASPTLNEHGFPDATPVAEMTQEQQTAYWRHKARKHEKNAKPTNFDEIAEKARQFDEQQEAGKTPDQRAVDAAAAAAAASARAEAIQKFGIPAVRAQLQAFRPNLTSDEIDELVEDVDMSKFITDDGVDVDRIKRLADKLTAPTGNGDTPPAAPAPNGGQALGFLLSNTEPPQGNAGSVDYYRQQEAERYKKTTNQ